MPLTIENLIKQKTAYKIGYAVFMLAWLEYVNPYGDVERTHAMGAGGAALSRCSVLGDRN